MVASLQTGLPRGVLLTTSADGIGIEREKRAFMRLSVADEGGYFRVV